MKKVSSMETQSHPDVDKEVMIESQILKIESMEVVAHPQGGAEISIPEYLECEYLDIEDQTKLVQFLTANINRHKPLKGTQR